MDAAARPFTTLLPSRARIVEWLPLVVFVLSPLFVYPWSFVRAGLLDGGDDALSNLPLLLHSARSLAKLELFWTPSLWLGTPLLDEPEFGVLYLPRLILLTMPPVLAFTIYVLSHYVLAQSGLYLYARTLGASRAAAVFGGLVYGFSGFMLGHRGHTMYVVAGAWSPFVLFFLRRAELRIGRANYLGAALSFAALPLCGAVQLTVYLGATVGLLNAIVAIVERRIRPLVVATIGLVAGGLLAMPQSLPSLGFVSELTALPRAGFDFSVALSYDPRLLPLLVVPHDPLISAELYSRIGAFALVFTVLGMLRVRSSVARAWTLVALASLVLMLGWHVPLLPKLLHRLPVIGVFRGPARHNFELGLATSILAAFGFDAAFARLPAFVHAQSGEWVGNWRFALWLAGAPVAVLALFVSARSLQKSQPALDQARALLPVLRSGWVTVGALALGLAIVSSALGALALGRFTRLARLAKAVVLLAPLVEGRLSTMLLDRVWPDYSAQLARVTDSLDAERRAPSRSSAGASLRVLPPPATIAGLDALADNGVALLPDTQNLIGYASMANQDAAVLFDLDMHGHPRAPTDLAWSRLPSIFGVTHLILPEAICAPLDVVATSSNASTPCAEVTGASLPENTLGALGTLGTVACTVALSEGVARFAAEAVPLPGITSAKSVDVEVTGRGVESGIRQRLTLSLTKEGPRRKWFFHGHVPQHGVLAVSSVARRPLDLKSFEILEEELLPVARISAAKPDGQSPSDGSDERALFLGGGHGKTVQTTFPLPDWLRTPNTPRLYDLPRLMLESALRAPAMPPSRAVAVDLYASDGFDPPSGQMGVEPLAVAPWFTRHSALVRPPPPPENVSLRVLYDGVEPIQIESATLYGGRRRPIVRLPESGEPFGRGFEATSVLHVEPNGLVLLAYHLPSRPVTVTVDTLATGAAAPLSFGVGYAPSLELPSAERIVLDTPALGPARHSFTLDAAIEATSLEVHARTAPSRGLRISRVEAESACRLRRYRPVSSLGNGLSLFANDAAAPRVFAVGSVRTVQNVEEVRSALREDPDFDPRQTALVQGLVQPPPLAPGIVGAAHFDGEHLEVHVTAPADRWTFLVVNDRFHPRWHAAIDGRAVPIYRTNGLVRGVVVPSGSHLVTMSFHPPGSAVVGAVLALVGLVLSVIAPRLDRRFAPL